MGNMDLGLNLDCFLRAGFDRFQSGSLDVLLLT